MRERFTPGIPGTDGKTDLYRMITRIVQEQLQFYNSPTVKAQVTTRGIRLVSNIPPPGAKGMKYASPLEYDMTQSYGGSVWVHVGASNDAVVTGTIDPDSGLQVNSTAGWYCSAPGGVPIETVDGEPAYHIPQVPLPNPDDIADPLNYWIIFIADAQCFGS